MLAHAGPAPQVPGRPLGLRLVRQRVLVPAQAFQDLGADRLDQHRRPGPVGGGLDRGDDHRDGAVDRHVAVVEPERGGHQAGGEVVVDGERLAVDRLRIAGGVGAGVDRDPAERGAVAAVAVEVVRRLDGDPVRGRHRAERRQELGHPGRAGGRLLPPALPDQGRVGGLPQGPVAQHVAAEPGRDREHGGDDGAALPGGVARPVDPGRPQLQRLRERGDAALGEARRPHPARVGRQPVDVVQGEAGVRHRGQARVDGETKRVNHQPPANARLANPSQRGPFLKLLFSRFWTGRADLTIGRDGEGLRPFSRGRARTGAGRRRRPSRTAPGRPSRCAPGRPGSRRCWW